MNLTRILRDLREEKRRLEGVISWFEQETASSPEQAPQPPPGSLRLRGHRAARNGSEARPGRSSP